MKRKDLYTVYAGLLVALLVALAASFVASPYPDGLERVAQDYGFAHRGEAASVFPAPAPDYLFPGIKNGKAATAAAGLLGTLAMFGIVCAVATIIKRRKD